MWKLFILILLIVAICIVLLALNILIRKNGKFPNTHVSGNPAMQKYGVGCAQSQDREAQVENAHAIAERNARN